jgi:signal transduction histidine kinase
VINLVSNAINHSPEDSVVRLNVQKIEKSEQSCMIQFKVIDSGKGINSDQMKNIFNKFYRAKDTISQKKGYGLGLYISKLIVEAHDGKIGAFNNREGGMTFYFSLPAIKRN